MFAPGDYVIYSVEGVCRVEEAGQLNVPGLERGRSYYRLTPYYRGGVIYTPVDGKAAIRPVMTKPALQALLPELPEMPELEDVPQDPRPKAQNRQLDRASQLENRRGDAPSGVCLRPRHAAS